MPQEYVMLITAAVLSYLFGSIPCGLLIGFYNGVDIRKVGSGNIGATNVTRSVSPLAGKLCFVCDFIKGLLPVVLSQALAPDHAVIALTAALAAILGHIFPIYLKFKGGKGVSTAAGAALALNPLALLAAAVVWVALFFAFRYVSLASIGAAVALPTCAWLFGVLKWGNQISTSPQVLGFFILISALAILRHIGNIKRLCNGTENRFERKKHPDAK